MSTDPTLRERIDFIQREIEAESRMMLDRWHDKYEPRAGDLLRTVAGQLADALDSTGSGDPS